MTTGFPGSEAAGAAGAAAMKQAEQAAERIRALNEELLAATRAAGSDYLDAYEKTLSNLLEFEKKAAGATQLDWVSALAKAHARFIEDVSAAYTSAARKVLP